MLQEMDIATEEIKMLQRSAYTPAVDPAEHHTKHGFVRACVTDLVNNGGFDPSEAFEACEARWEDSEQIGSPVTAGQKTLDPITQKLWDDHIDARCIAIVDRRIKPLAEHIGEKLGSLVRDINKNVDGIDKNLAAVSVDLKAVTKEMVVELRENMRRETRLDMDSWVKRMDRNFNLEVVALQEKTIRQLNTDLDTMRTDMTKVMMNNLREELADEVVKMFVEARDQIRKELRAEMAAKIKLLRSTFVKRNRK